MADNCGKLRNFEKSRSFADLTPPPPSPKAIAPPPRPHPLQSTLPEPPQGPAPGGAGEASEGGLRQPHVPAHTFCTPRIIMHMCAQSMITATPIGFRVSWRAFAISRVRRSCT